jgi:hypothetical protein
MKAEAPKDKAPETKPATEPKLAKTLDRMHLQLSQLRIAQARLAAAQAELELRHQDLRQRGFELEQRLGELGQQDALLRGQQELLDDKDTEGKKEVKRQRARLQLEQTSVRAALESVRFALGEPQRDNPPKARSGKLLPLKPQLDRLRRELFQEMELDFAEVEQRDAYVGTFLDIISKKYRLTIFGAGDAVLLSPPFPSGKITVAGFIQLIEDRMKDHVFVLRDYGLCIIHRNKLKPDMLTYREFRRDYLPVLGE